MAAPSAFQREPPLQHKKRVASPLTRGSIAATLVMDEDVANNDEYILLGNQNKFQTNIKYPLSKSDSRKKAKPENVLPDASVLSPPAAPRVPPPPKVIVDTGAPTKSRSTKSNLEANGKEKNGLAFPSKVVSDTQVLKKNTQTQVKQSQIEKEPEKRDLKFLTNDTTKSQNNQNLVKSHAVQTSSAPQPLPSKLPTKSEAIRDASYYSTQERKVQEEANKLRADKETEAKRLQAEKENDYALKYKYDVAPARPIGPKRLSEYQKQFKWQSTDTSPLLAAAQAMHVAQSSVPVAMRTKKPKVSEYQARFQSWASSANSNNNNNVKRSQSLESVQLADERKAANENRNASRTPVPPRRSASGLKSEYASRYYEPAQYEYVQGAWHESLEQPLPERNWFNEIIELRKRATEYKKRAQGSHFSHEHLGQLYAQQANLWDARSSIGGSQLSSARDIVTPREPLIKKEAELVQVENTEKRLVNSAVQTRRYKHRPHDTENLLNHDNLSSIGSQREVDVNENGDNLSEATLQSARYTEDEPLQVESLDVEPIAKVADVRASPKRAVSHNNLQTSQTSSASTLKTFGKPTVDSHVLVDDLVDRSRPLVSQYLCMPQTGHDENSHKVAPLTVENLGADAKNVTRDDDDVSVASVRSLASSCSLASQVLERARNRRDNFWKPNVSHV